MLAGPPGGHLPVRRPLRLEARPALPCELGLHPRFLTLSGILISLYYKQTYFDIVVLKMLLEPNKLFPPPNCAEGKRQWRSLLVGSRAVSPAVDAADAADPRRAPAA